MRDFGDALGTGRRCRVRGAGRGFRAVTGGSPWGLTVDDFDVPDNASGAPPTEGESQGDSGANAGQIGPFLPADAAPIARPQHDPGTGQFLPGNTLRLKTGRYSRQLARPEPADEARASLEAELLAGLEAPDLFDRDLVTAYLDLTAVLRFSASRMVRRELHAADRRAAFAAYIEAQDRRLRILQHLAPQRRPSKATPTEPIAWLQSLPDAQAEGAQDDDDNAE